MEFHKFLNCKYILEIRTGSKNVIILSHNNNNVIKPLSLNGQIQKQENSIHIQECSFLLRDSTSSVLMYSCVEDIIQNLTAGRQKLLLMSIMCICMTYISYNISHVVHLIHTYLYYIVMFVSVSEKSQQHTVR